MIIGAGLGGICLAQNLKKNGINATIYERHHARSYLAEGFWIEINDEGTAALRECLSPQHFEDLMAKTRPTNRPECRWMPRAALQSILLCGLKGVVQFNRTFIRYEARSDGRVAALFSDGTCAIADVLVAADGVHSRIRQQMLPQARRIDTGVLAIGGTAALSAEIMKVIPPHAFEYPIAVNGPDNRQIFIALWREQRLPGQSPGSGMRSRLAAPDDGAFGYELGDHMMWRFAALTSDYALRKPPEDVPAAELKATVLDMMTSWSPPLRRLVELIDVPTIFALPIRTCVPLDHWTTGAVTLVGDAIHGMAPYGGFGANTAMRDAAVLGQSLACADRGEKTLLQAISDYEVRMIDYGFDAARRSMQILQQANKITLAPLA